MIRLEHRPIAFDRDQTNTLSVDNLLTIFRIVTISRFIVALIIYFILSSTLDDRNPGRLLAMLEALLLTIYLSVGVLHRLLGERYLTIALLWGSVLPLLISSLTIYLVFTAPVPPLMQSRIGASRKRGGGEQYCTNLVRLTHSALDCQLAVLSQIRDPVLPGDKCS